MTVPRVEGRSLIMSDRSVAVMLCPLRLCDWHSEDVRTMPLPVQEEVVGLHLLREHEHELRTFARLAADGDLIP